MSAYQVVDLARAELLELFPGVWYRPVVVGRLGAGRIEMRAGVVTTPHRHDDEQASFLLSGKVEYEIWAEEGSRKEVVTPGMLIVIGSDVLHKVSVLEDAVVLEAWTPAERHLPYAIAP